MSEIRNSLVPVAVWIKAVVAACHCSMRSSPPSPRVTFSMPAAGMEPAPAAGLADGVPSAPW